jgi:clathrin heavy chain
MNEMLKVNMRQNLQVVVQIATKYSDLLGPVKLIEMFEQYKTFDGASRNERRSLFHRHIDGL